MEDKTIVHFYIGSVPPPLFLASEGQGFGGLSDYTGLLHTLVLWEWTALLGGLSLTPCPCPKCSIKGRVSEALAHSGDRCDVKATVVPSCLTYNHTFQDLQTTSKAVKAPHSTNIMLFCLYRYSCNKFYCTNCKKVNNKQYERTNTAIDYIKSYVNYTQTRVSKRLMDR